MKQPQNAERFDALRRRARILLLLRGARNAGLYPISILALHAYAYFSNVLAPVWDMPTLDGKILKRKGGPFYPVLQTDLDRLVGMGMVQISDVAHVRDSEGKWRLEGQYALNMSLAESPLRFLLCQPDEGSCCGFPSGARLTRSPCSPGKSWRGR